MTNIISVVPAKHSEEGLLMCHCPSAESLLVFNVYKIQPGVGLVIMNLRRIVSEAAPRIGPVDVRWDGSSLLLGLRGSPRLVTTQSQRWKLKQYLSWGPLPLILTDRLGLYRIDTNPVDTVEGV